METKPSKLILLLAVLVVVGIQKIASAGDTSVNVPLKAGTASVVTGGSVAVCLNPAAGYVEVNCATHGAQAFPITVANVGTITSNGHIACQTVDATTSNFPVDISPPGVTKNQNSTITILNYNPHTGAGDGSFITYNGGHCNGINFDKTGATVNSFGTFHLAISENGNRTDTIITALQDPLGGIGDFSFTGVARALVPTNP